MKGLSLSLSFLFFLSNLIYSQDFQVTNMQGYSVETPKFSIVDGNTYLTFALNTKLYKFPATGPQSPISNPITIDPNYWGPDAVDIAAFGNNVYVLANDFSYPVYIEKISYSTNGGLDWNNYTIDTIQNMNYIPVRGDLPRVIVSRKGTPYFFYYVFNNSNDTSGLYMYANGVKKKLDLNIPRARYEYGICPFVVTRSNVDHIYVSYFIDSSYYFIHSSDDGQTFSQPQVIKSFFVLWASDSWRPRFQIDNSNKLYFYYSYMDFGQPGQPPENKNYHLLTTSTDWGMTWSPSILIDTNFYDIDFRIVDNKFVKSYSEEKNIYLQSSSDLINWTDPTRVNTVDSSVVGGFETQVYNGKLALAWKDNRTGYEEIFYRLMDVPTKVNETKIPNHFTLYQNFPNPFNPTTTISFTLNQKAKTKLRVYDLFGKLVRELINDELNAGDYNIEFSGRDLSAGVYFYQLISGKYKATHKMILLK